ncbi:MAG: DUF346 domain-containing protein [Polyangiaceae bacterium]|nr:DUF346 domain-containing protein [Polyangiaceae bacterium]
MTLRTTTAAAFTLALVALAGCAPSDPTEDEFSENADDRRDSLSSAQKKPRYERIREAARDRGIQRNGYLFAGIANDETGLAMCWSEAQWACKGPASPDCGGGPIIAGSADGPCSDQQGGLGMFQFDAGTYSQTISKYGNAVLTTEGQLSSAVDYVVRMVRDSDYTTNAETDAKAFAWLNNFDVNNPTLRDQWIKTVVRYYNGCQPGWSCWSSRYQTYSEGLDLAIEEPGGLDFWATGGGGSTSSQGPEGGLAFLYPNQQHLVHSDGAGNVRHHWWDGNENKIFTDTWGTGTAGDPVSFVHGTSQHVFARGTDGSLKHWFWDPANGPRNDVWAAGGSIAGDPAAIVIGDYEDVWAVDQGGKLQHWFWGPDTNGVQHDTWGQGVVGRPSVFVTKDGAQHAFARGTGGTLEHWWWTPGGGISHDTWGTGLAGDPTAMTFDEFQAVWAVDGAGNLQHWYWGPNTNGVQHDTWGAGVVGRPSVFVTENGEQHAFVRGKNGTVEHWWWAPGAGISHDTWGNGIAKDPTAITIGAQQHVWALDSAGHAQHWFWDPDTNSIKHDDWGK